MDVREKLVELLSKYFDIGDSYCYNLTRTKNAFACGTMGFDDFEEFDDETVADIADHLIANGVTVQEWISVKDRLPDNRDDVLLCRKWAGTTMLVGLGSICPTGRYIMSPIGCPCPSRRKENDYAVLGVRKVRKSKSVEKNLLEVWE